MISVISGLTHYSNATYTSFGNACMQRF